MSGLIGGAGSKSGVIGLAGTNNPAFSAYRTNSYDPGTTGTWYTLVCDNEDFDSFGKYDNSTGIFTPGVVGKYFLSATVARSNSISDNTTYKSRITNQSSYLHVYDYSTRDGVSVDQYMQLSVIVNVTSSSDAFKVEGWQNSHPDTQFMGGTHGCRFSGYRIINN